MKATELYRTGLSSCLQLQDIRNVEVAAFSEMFHKHVRYCQKATIGKLTAVREVRQKLFYFLILSNISLNHISLVQHKFVATNN
jgi:hypothetical protein